MIYEFNRVTNSELGVLRSFKFDRIYDQTASQDKLFKDLQIKTLVQKVVDGFHATIFAYGQTGSGKTYTMENIYDYSNRVLINDKEYYGISFRSITELFKQLRAKKEANKNFHFSIYCSFLQIYNEKIYDLLNANSLHGNGLRLRWNKEDQFKVENLFIFEIENEEEAKAIYLQGIKNRAVAPHKLNLFSSRSHSIFTIMVESLQEDMEESVISKLQLVDLAGSERASLTGNNTNERHLKESIDINKSLFTLRKVISTLAESNSDSVPFIPYRESKLTCLLKQSLGGNSYCLMVSVKLIIDCLYIAIRFVCE